MDSILHFFAPQLAAGRSEEEEEEEEDDDCVDTTSQYAEDVGWKKFRELLRSFFPSYDTDYSNPAEISPVPAKLLEAIQTQLQERHLQTLPSLIEKVCRNHRFLPLMTTYFLL